METTVIRKIKRPGYTVLFPAYLLDDDEHGTWFFMPSDSVVRYVDGDETLLQPFTHAPGILLLAPRDQWWFGAWWPRAGRRFVATDACSPTVLVDGAWTWTDLELDVCRDADGAVWIEDQDDFEAAIAGGHIPADEQRAAIAIADQLATWLSARTAPFDDTGWRRFDAAAALGLAPLGAPDF